MRRRCNETFMKRFLRWFVDGYHWMHILWGGVLIPFGGAYLFFSEPGMDWRVDLITTIIFLPFALFVILFVRSMIRKQLKTSGSQTLPQEPSPINPIQKVRSEAR